MRRLALFALLSAACSDYQFHEEKAENAPPADTGAPITDEDPGEDTAEDTGEPTDTADTGEPVDEVPATEPIYINEGDTLWSWDPAADELTRIGSFGVDANMTDIAIDPEGQIWACTYDGLYRVNPATGAASFVAPLDNVLHGLTFISDGRMVGAGEGVWIIDPETGRTSSTLVYEGSFNTSGDIIGLPDGLLYWTVWNDEHGEADQLVVIDPAGGHAVRGGVEVDRVFGLGYAHGDLFGFTDEGGWVEINPALGGLRDEGPLPGNSGWWGATTNPVLW